MKRDEDKHIRADAMTRSTRADPDNHALQEPGHIPSVRHSQPQMSSQTPEQNEISHWESVHKCPKCGYELSLGKLDLYATTTGTVTCSKCKWSGQIDLQIVPR